MKSPTSIILISIIDRVVVNLVMFFELVQRFVSFELICSGNVFIDVGFPIFHMGVEVWVLESGGRGCANLLANFLVPQLLAIDGEVAWLLFVTNTAPVHRTVLVTVSEFLAVMTDEVVVLGVGRVLVR
jgi:hypothetical protein